jgi:hypothetical protein
MNRFVTRAALGLALLVGWGLIVRVRSNASENQDARRGHAKSVRQGCCGLVHSTRSPM